MVILKYTMDCKDKAVTSGSDIDEFLEEENNEDSSDIEHFDMMADLAIFFAVVQERIAKVTEKALRGEITKKEEVKMQTLKEKHRRPANIANMQIPKIILRTFYVEAPQDRDQSW